VAERGLKPEEKELEEAISGEELPPIIGEGEIVERIDSRIDALSKLYDQLEELYEALEEAKKKGQNEKIKRISANISSIINEIKKIELELGLDIARIEKHRLILKRLHLRNRRTRKIVGLGKKDLERFNKFYALTYHYKIMPIHLFRKIERLGLIPSLWFGQAFEDVITRITEEMKEEGIEPKVPSDEVLDLFNEAIDLVNDFVRDVPFRLLEEPFGLIKRHVGELYQAYLDFSLGRISEEELRRKAEFLKNLVEQYYSVYEKGLEEFRMKPLDEVVNELREDLPKLSAEIYNAVVKSVREDVARKINPYIDAFLDQIEDTFSKMVNGEDYRKISELAREEYRLKEEIAKKRIAGEDTTELEEKLDKLRDEIEDLKTRLESLYEYAYKYKKYIRPKILTNFDKFLKEANRKAGLIDVIDFTKYLGDIVTYLNLMNYYTFSPYKVTEDERRNIELFGRRALSRIRRNRILEEESDYRYLIRYYYKLYKMEERAAQKSVEEALG